MNFYRGLFANYQPITAAPAEPSQQTISEIFDYEQEKQKVDINYKKSIVTARKWVGICTFICVWAWLFTVLYFVYCSGLGKSPIAKNAKFGLSDTVIITLTTTTTATIIASFSLIVKNLFPSK